MWTYNSATGALARGGTIEGYGYSGNGSGLNCPAMSVVPNVGPIPAGEWTIGKFFDDIEGDDPKGKLVCHLTPVFDTDTHDRSGFMIHGDNAAMDHTASEGCIILSHILRQLIADSGDTDLLVL